jgi:hypothetical protein
VARAEIALLGDTLGDLEGLVANHQIFMRHFSRWLHHLSAEDSARVTAEVVEQIKAPLDRILEAIAQNRELIDPQIAITLQSLEETAIEQAESARPIWFGVIRGLNNLLHSLAKFGIEFGGRTRDEVVKQGSKRAADFLVSLVGAGLMVVIGILPVQFAWLLPVLSFLNDTSDKDSKQ